MTSGNELQRRETSRLTDSLTVQTNFQTSGVGARPSVILEGEAPPEPIPACASAPALLSAQINTDFDQELASLSDQASADAGALSGISSNQSLTDSIAAALVSFKNYAAFRQAYLYSGLQTDLMDAESAKRPAEDQLQAILTPLYQRIPETEGKMRELIRDARQAEQQTAPPVRKTVTTDTGGHRTQKEEDAFSRGFLWVQMIEKAYAASGLRSSYRSGAPEYNNIAGGSSQLFIRHFTGKAYMAYEMTNSFTHNKGNSLIGAYKNRYGSMEDLSGGIGRSLKAVLPQTIWVCRPIPWSILPKAFILVTGQPA